MTSPLDAARRLSASTVNLLLTRAQFASVELAQSRAQLMRWVGLALIGAVLALLALMALSAFLLIVFWDAAGPWSLLVLTVLYAVVGFLVVRRLQRELHYAPPLLSETLAELAQDRDAILGRAAGADETRSAGSAP
ncbi:MAG: phage holin family protein [Gemmatimonadota bacterium]